MHNWIIQAKLWNRVKFPEIEAHFYTGCWLWTGKRCGKGGHGQLAHKGRTYIASRVAYEVATGQILPDTLVVRHKCPEAPNPRCCNPAHLTSGTPMDNVIDRMVARRSATGQRNGAYTKPDKVRRGETHGMAKITEEDVRKIRATHRVFQGHGFGSFWARKLGLPVNGVLNIIKGRAWTHVLLPADYELEPGLLLQMQKEIEAMQTLRLDKWHQARDGKPGGKPKLDEDKVRQIRARRLETPCPSYDQLGAEFGVSGKVICDVVNRKAWVHVI